MIVPDTPVKAKSTVSMEFPHLVASKVFELPGPMSSISDTTIDKSCKSKPIELTFWATSWSD